MESVEVKGYTYRSRIWYGSPAVNALLVPSTSEIQSAV